MLDDIQITPLGRLRAVFRFDRPRHVLIELSINPVGGGVPSAQELAQILKTVGDGQAGHFVDSSASSGEGDWDEVIAFAKCCHEAVRLVSGHVISTIRIEDERSTLVQADATRPVDGGLSVKSALRTPVGQSESPTRLVSDKKVIAQHKEIH